MGPCPPQLFAGTPSALTRQRGDGRWAVLKFFTGTWTHKLDAKGRVSLPADFRRVLQAVESDHIVVVPFLTGDDRHSAFSQKGIETLIERFEAEDHSEEEMDAFDERVTAAAFPVQIDDTGRIVLSRALREGIGAAGEVSFVGRRSFFEIWEPERRAREVGAKDRPRRPLNLKGLH